jgi:hypothetical protein
MVRASALPEGETAPIEIGLSNHDRMNRTSSLRRSPLLRSKRRIRLSIFFSSDWRASNGIGWNVVGAPAT